MATLDPVLVSIATISIVAIVLTLMFRALKQPYIIAYILTGVLIGPYALGIISDPLTIQLLGNLGVVFLMFFIGMEISVPKLVKRWRIPVIGTLLQVVCSVLITVALGSVLGWSWERMILIGFVITMSSTVVVIRWLEQAGETETRVGQDVLGVTLAQDLAIVPMLVIINALAGTATSTFALVAQIFVGMVLIAVVSLTVRRGTIRIPFVRKLRSDRELQLFGALGLALGLALLTELVGLSAALGAFVAGILVSAAKEATWVSETLQTFKIFFVALFFVGIGLLVDISFFWEHALIIIILTTVVLLVNTVLNAFVLRSMGESWKHSIYFGSLLAQIGEFSFVLAAMGLFAGFINAFGYQLTVSVIVLSLFFSPFWISSTRRFLYSPFMLGKKRYRQLSRRSVPRSRVVKR